MAVWPKPRPIGLFCCCCWPNPVLKLVEPGNVVVVVVAVAGVVVLGPKPNRFKVVCCGPVVVFVVVAAAVFKLVFEPNKLDVFPPVDGVFKLNENFEFIFFIFNFYLISNFSVIGVIKLCNKKVKLQK